MADCIFCKIIEGKIPAKIVYQDELVVAFEDANPRCPLYISLLCPENTSPRLTMSRKTTQY